MENSAKVASVDLTLKSKQNKNPLPLVVAEEWKFTLNAHVVHDEHFYAIEDWIAGLTNEFDRIKAQNTWKKLKNKMVISIHHLNYSGTDGKTYKKAHTDDRGLYLIVQNLRVTKNRQELREIKEYLAEASVFVDNLRTNKHNVQGRLRKALNEENPGAAIDEAIEAYRRKGYSDKWIFTRLKGKPKRLKLTGIMDETCIDTPQYGKATNAGYQGAFHLIKSEIVQKLDLSEAQSRYLRDYLSQIALQGIALYEAAASEKMRSLGRSLTKEEQVVIVRECAELVSPSLHSIAEYLGIDLLSGEKLLSAV